MISQREYNKRVRHNTDLMDWAIAYQKSIFEIIPLVATLEHGVDDFIHDVVLKNNINDIIPALYLGVLPTVKHTGRDAIEMKKSVVTDLELKFTTFSMTQLWMKKKHLKGLYIGNGNGIQQTTITSALSGSFQIHSDKCKESKRRDTILMVADTTLPLHAVMAFRLDGNTVYDYLALSDNRMRSIKISAFLNHGEQINTIHDTLSWDQYRGLACEHVDTLENWQEHRGSNYDVSAIHESYNDLLSH